ncbi:MAG: hypothetical protein L3J32_07840 [Rhizobiaceae bacterium]|nr:hypothetical protein [Rhizobiaceae bacterium]
MSAVLALVILIGVYPMPILNMTAASTSALAERLEERSQAMSAGIKYQLRVSENALSVTR